MSASTKSKNSRQVKVETGAGFSKERRLLKSKEFKKILNNGQKVVCAELVFVAQPSVLHSGEPVSRVGLIVSRKVGKANIRNKVKRRLREIFRQYSKFRENKIPSMDLVIIARYHAQNVSYQALEKAFCESVERLIRKQKNHPTAIRTVTSPPLAVNSSSAW